ncbi:unconventional myosin-Vc isoform X3 [Scleropages formosus]|uniref:unconventional myosin-Vc isoform X3 n=1 Tax=Scleropages formosus TaxID=113540 RepID=UPI0010FAC1EA|nr:unconventional myosin-Vc isoform X3 [Scleropages formosus]
MALSELYTKYNRVWIPDAEHVWKSAEILKDYTSGSNYLEVQLEDGTELKYALDTANGQLPPLRNPDILVGENDLTALSYLHEPAVLHNLKVRFVESRIIYTYCGIILVAINPYKQLPLYGDAIIHAYSGQNMGDMDPHIFAVAEEAYKQMARKNKNQSIIVSGESGAGKTVSARYTMRYFATVSKSGSKAHVEDKVLASNPITEAIGNAKTTRNDNSSRFGKYTEISFDKSYQIIGANMRTYLLEKSRVVFQSENERNYHIFYQLCSSVDDPEFKNLRLLTADKFVYTSMGGRTDIDSVDDKADMMETRRTFSLLGLKEDFQIDVFRVLAGILHLGNIEIRAAGTEKSSISSSDYHLGVFCELLDVSAEDVSRWLCQRRIVLVAETVVKPVPQKRAINARDALAKHIYAHLFDYIIHKINTVLQFPGKQHTFIGVLDIYGFETFEVNSFEQFCINYANEKLQQQFNLHVFKLEQEEYMKEDIPWTLIDFYDNQPVIDLIEAKMGILDLLDEECLFPQGTDQNWLQKLYNNYLDKNALFEKPRMSNQAFLIQHFADKVEYQCKGFLEKNRDILPEELVEIMRVSKFHLLSDFFQEEELGLTLNRGIKVRPARPSVKPANKQLRTTVGNKFRSSLYLLMETLNATTPHYVRCIKPNDEKLPFEYDSKRVVQQLRACGVLETIHISAQSYPSRWTYIEFYSRYSILMSQAELGLNDKKQTCKTVLQRLIQDSNQYKFGRTKIFFRAGQVAYLEKLRSDRLRGACITIQKHVRGWSQHRKFLQMRAAAIIIQQYVRGSRTIRQTVTAENLKRAWAAVVIQRYVRGHLVRQVYQLVKVATVTIQSHTRGWLARKRFRQMVADHKAVVLQKYARAWLARRRFQNIRRLVLNVQLSYRVQQLKKKLEEQSRENHGLLERLTAMSNARVQDMDKLQKLEAELSKLANEKISLEQQQKMNKESTDQVIIQLQAQNNMFAREKEELEQKLADSVQQIKDSTEELKSRFQEELEREGRQRKIVENNIAIQKKDHEKEIEALNVESRKLREENVSFQKQIEEQGEVTQDLQEQVLKLTKHVKLIPQFKQQVSELQRQKHELEVQIAEQACAMEVKMEEVSNNLHSSRQEESAQRRLLEMQKAEHAKEKEELERRLEEKEEETLQLKKQNQMESEAKNRLRQEVSRLVTDNMEFEEQLDVKDRLIKKLENQIKSLLASEIASQTPAPAIPKEYLGMLEYRKEDESQLIQNIILGLKPRGVVVNMIPGLIAHILFMCIRHADYINDEGKIKSLMRAIIDSIKKVVKTHQEDFDMLSFWLSNTYQMLNCLKQYSGEEDFMKYNTPRQNKNCLQNFDLSEYRQIISDVAIHIYHQFVTIMEKALMPLIVPGMLEHESLQGISSMKPTGFRKRSTSIYEDTEACTISSILQQLSHFHSTMMQHGMDIGLIKQAVKQQFFLVGAASLNGILLRKDMCSCRKGMQIRCNISYLEEWLKEKDLQSSSAIDTMEPLSQAAWLLQVNKSTDEDAQQIAKMCTELSPVQVTGMTRANAASYPSTGGFQIVKILNSYTPIDDFEKRVSPSFVRKVQSLLQDRVGSGAGSAQLMLDTQYRYQVIFPFVPSPQALELIQVPSSLKLNFLTRI